MCFKEGIVKGMYTVFYICVKFVVPPPPSSTPHLKPEKKEPMHHPGGEIYIVFDGESMFACDKHYNQSTNSKQSIS